MILIYTHIYIIYVWIRQNIYNIIVFLQESLFNTGIKKIISSRFSRNSEANALESLENLKWVFVRCCIHNNYSCDIGKSTILYQCFELFQRKALYKYLLLCIMSLLMKEYYEWVYLISIMLLTACLHVPIWTKTYTITKGWE